MDALDFPPNPVPGDIFLNWMWDGTKWTRIGGIPTQTVVFMSPSPPPYPELGNLWWDSVGGNLYVWFIDSTSSQWVIANLGMQGLQGPPGPPGPQGATGAAVNILPPVVTFDDLPLTGNNAGDGRVTLDTGDLWVWDGNGWFTTGPIQGPPGNQGPAGPAGPTGPPFQPATTGTGNVYALSIGPTISAPTILSPSITGGATIAGNLNTGPQLIAGAMSQVGAGSNFSTVGTVTAAEFLNSSGVDVVEGRPVANPPAASFTTTATSAVNTGIVAQITPVLTGRVLMLACGLGATDAPSGAPYLSINCQYGSGAPPAAGTPWTGSPASAPSYLSTFFNNQTSPWVLMGLITTLTLNTEWWFQIVASANGAYNCQLSQVQLILIEI